MEDFIIRLERKEDHFNVEKMVRESFWNVYRPGCLEHYLLNQLRSDKDFVKELDLVLELDGEIIGQVAYVKSRIQLDDRKELPTLTIGPICIDPRYQQKGYGKILLDYSLNKAKELGYGAVFLEGNIEFYKNSSFTYARNYGIRYHGLSIDEDTSFFLCKELKEGYLSGALGEYIIPQGYFIDENKVDEFDKKFPKKKKEKLECQIF